MENRLGNSNGLGNPKKSRSLDLKTLYKSSVLKESLNKRLKRKNSDRDGDDQQKQDKKRRKVVSLSSFEKLNSDNGKDLEKSCKDDLILHDLKDSKAGFSQELSSGSKFHGISLGLDGSVIHIPKRRRGFVGKNKFENNQVLEPTEKSINKVGLIDQIPEASVDESTTQDRLSKDRQNSSDDSREKRESDPAVHLKSKGGLAGHSAIANSDLALKKSQSNHRKRKALASDSKIVAKNVEPSVSTSHRISEGLREDDEENLEANAARMLSSRFNPNCTRFSSNIKVPLSPSIDRLPSLSSSGQNSAIPRSKPSKSKSTSADTDDRKLRPRQDPKDKGTTRKRRHFYEILSSDVDSSWLLNRRIKVFWPLDESWYHGLVDDYDRERQLHHVKYDDRDEEWINLQGERFKILLLPTEVPSMTQHKKCRTEATSRKIKGDRKSSIAEERQNLMVEDEGSMEYMESEPIITWLAQSTHRVRSSTLHAMKKQRISGLLPSEEPVKADGSVAEYSMAQDKMRTTTSSLPSRGLVDGRNTPKSSKCLKGSKHPIVYYRRRFHRERKTMCQVSGGNNVRVPKHLDVSRNLDPDVDFWPIDDSGISELSSQWKESKEFGVSLSFPVVVFLDYSLIPNSVWLFHAIFLLHHGTVTSMWPRVYLEMLFLDNLVGLRYLFFEGCLMEAVVLIFRVLTVFHQSDEQGKYTDLQFPVFSIGFRLSCIPDFGRHLAFAFYNFCEVKVSKWTYLEQKLKRHSLLSRQLALSECTHNTIKALQNGQSMDTSVSRNSPSFESIQKGSSQGISLMHVSRESSFTEACPSSIYDMKQSFISPLALSFAAAPAFFFSLHLKMFMEHSKPHINFQGHDSKECLETSSSLSVDDCSNVDDCISKRSKSSPENDLRANSGVGKQISSPRKHQHDGPSAVSPSPQEREETKDGASVPKGQDQQSESEKCKLSSVDRYKTSSGSNRPLNGIRIEVPQSGHCQGNTDSSRGTQQSTDLTLNMQGGSISGSNPTAPRSTWHRSRSSSSSFGYLSHGLSDAKGEYLHANFGNGPKKPRTQVSYSLPSGGFESRNKGHLQKGIPNRRIRRSNDRKSADVSRGPRQKDLDSSSCDANVLVTIGDRGWRECGARVVLEPCDDNEWKLAIKVLGTTRYSYKAHQFLQPGSTNRYTHAMMWRGGKDWILEFPDRSQWSLFKEMHEECYNRNIRAASVRNIPIPGVRLTEENDDNGTEVTFARGSSKYFRQTETDVEMALDPSRVFYDMDSDDEQWLSKICGCSEAENSRLCEITEEMLEKAMDMFEKAAYVQQRDQFTSNEIEELMAGAGRMEGIESIYDHWRRKRQRKGMPLIRHLQPPLWERYQQQLKDWELAMAKTNTLSSNGIHEKGVVIEKPAMFAFCLKPRGLEVPNKGLKHQSQKKLSVYMQNNTFLGDHDGLYTFGRRSSGIASGEENILYSGHNYEYIEELPLHQISPRVFSPRDTALGYFSLCSNSYDRNRQQKFQRSKSKKIGVLASSGDAYTSYSQRTMGKNRIYRWSVDYSEWSSPNNYYFNGSYHPNPEELDGSDLDEFKLRDATSMAKHARALAKLKRERAERLHYKANIEIQKAVAALMTAEAIKASLEDSGNVSE